MSRGMANGPAELREHFYRTASEDLEAEVPGLEAAVDRIERPSPVRKSGDRRRPQGANACAAMTGAEADKAYAQTVLTSACAAIVTAPDGDQESTLHIQSYAVGRLVCGGLLTRSETLQRSSRRPDGCQFMEIV